MPFLLVRNHYAPIAPQTSFSTFAPAFGKVGAISRSRKGRLDVAIIKIMKDFMRVVQQGEAFAVQVKKKADAANGAAASDPQIHSS